MHESDVTAPINLTEVIVVEFEIATTGANGSVVCERNFNFFARILVKQTTVKRATP